jgi:hypothetical protein
MKLQEIGEKCIMKSFTTWGDMDWINLAQNKDQWKALVNTIMYLRVP